MEMPDYWLRRPEPRWDSAMAAAFDSLLDEALAGGPGRPIDYRLDAPKWQFLCHVVERANLVLHGSGDPGIGLFEPRQPDDELEFSNRFAVFAAADGIWPLFYAVTDRVNYPMSTCNACIRVHQDAGEPSSPYYFFSISDPALRQRPWRAGMVYLLPADTFELQPPLAFGGARIEVVQAASPVPVSPLARLSVDPGDFPFLEQVRGHDDQALRARMAAEPDGFPWLETP